MYYIHTYLVNSSQHTLSEGRRALPPFFSLVGGESLNRCQNSRLACGMFPGSPLLEDTVLFSTHKIYEASARAASSLLCERDRRF